MTKVFRTSNSRYVFDGEGSIKVPVGTNSNRPDVQPGDAGWIRFNQVGGALEVFTGTTWTQLASANVASVTVGTFVSKSGDEMTGKLKLGMGNSAQPSLTFQNASAINFFAPGRNQFTISQNQVRFISLQSGLMYFSPTHRNTVITSDGRMGINTLPSTGVNFEVSGNAQFDNLTTTNLNVAGLNPDYLNVQFGADFNSIRLQNVGTPLVDTDAANKLYVDLAVTGFSWKDAVRVATTSNIVLFSTQLIDGVTVADGDRVLVKNQNDTTQNGIYEVKAGANWVRTSDTDNLPNPPGREFRGGTAVFVAEGLQNADTGWVVNYPQGNIEIGVDNVSWVQFSGAQSITPGVGISVAGNTLSVNDKVVLTSGNQSIDGTKTFSSTISGSITGNAGTATTLQTARTIALTGGVTGTATSFNGGANISIPVTSVDATSLSGTINTARLPSDVVKTTGNQTIGGIKTFSSTISGSITGNAGTATTLQTPRTISLTGGVTGTATPFNGSANISIPVTSVDASVITGTVDSLLLPSDVVKTTGNQTIGGTKTFSSTISGSITGNAGTATTLQTPRTISLTGGVTGTATSFNGGANISIPVTGINANNINTGTVSLARLPSELITQDEGDVRYLLASGTATQASNADTLDGIDSTGFVQIAGTQTITGAKTFSTTVNAATFNATSTTNGGFQGIDTDTAALPSFTWTGDQNTGIFRPGADIIGFTAGGVERGRINTTGFSGDGSQLINLNANNINAGTIDTARLPADVVKTTGNQTIGGIKTFSSTISGSITGNAGTATTLQTARTIALTGGVTGTATSFNGSANISIPVTGINANNINAGTIDTARLPADVVKTTGNQTIGGNKTFSGYIIESLTTGIAAAGSNQGGATQLNTSINNVITVAANTGVRLPTPVAGMKVVVFNNGANSLRIYPNTGHIITGKLLNEHIPLGAGASITLYGTNTTTWIAMYSPYG